MKAKFKITFAVFMLTALPLIMSWLLPSDSAWMQAFPLAVLLAAALLLGRQFGGPTDSRIGYFLQDGQLDSLPVSQHNIRSVAPRDAADADDQRRLSLLCEASRTINRSLTLQELLTTLTEYARQLVSAESALMGRMEGERLRVDGVCRQNGWTPLDLSMAPGEYAGGRAVAEGVPCAWNGPTTESQVPPDLAETGTLVSLCAVPIVDEIIGVQGYVEVHNKRGGGPFDHRDLELLETLAAIANTGLKNARMMEGHEQALNELNNSKAQLSSLAEKLSANTGTAYFRSLVAHLTDELGVRYAFVGQLSADRKGVDTLAVQVDGQPAQNFSYLLRDTPCEQVVGEGVCMVPDSVQSRYPKDGLLQDMGVESYAAVSLNDGDGEAIGLLVVLHSEALENAEEQISLLRLFAVRARAELQRQRNHEALKLAATAFQTHEAIMICDAKGDILRVNNAFTTITGYSEGEVVGRNARLLSSGLQDDAFYQAMWESLGAKGFWQGELWNRTKQGTLLAEWLSINRVSDDEGQTTHYVGAFLDLTKQKAQQAFIERAIGEEEVLSTLLRFSHRGSTIEGFLGDGMRVLNDSHACKRFLLHARLVLTAGETGEPLTSSESAQEECGYCASASRCPVQSRSREALPGLNESTELLQIQVGEGEQPGCYRVPIRDKDLFGALVCCLRPDYQPCEADQTFLLRVADVLVMGISRRRVEAQIEYQAYHDDLTGLPNRRMLTDRLGQEVAVAKRRGLHGTLLFIDLDQFKRLNDALGHSIGDLLLQQVAERLRGLLRTQDTVARLGGDEFVVILPALDGDEEQAGSHAFVVAEKIRAALSQLYHLAEHEFQLTPSIGIAVFPAAGDTADDLLKHADAAMYLAKREGRNTARFYQPSLQEQASERLALEKDLRQSLQDDQLTLHFQPQVSSGGVLVGAEVLLRWHHPQRGAVSPALFIPVAEDAGLILEIGDWVLAMACRQIKCWEEQGRACCHLAVNVSPKQFRQPGFVESVIKILDATGINPDHLELEVTEGMLIRDIEHTIEKMTQLRERGIRFSIDDFGTGYSSLNYLKRLPLDILKIDRTFVTDVHLDAQDAAICATIISMAQHLKLKVIAEGVETLEEHQFLEQNGCDTYQGFYFSRPLPLADFEALPTVLPRESVLP